MFKRFFAFVFLLFMAFALMQCARRGRPTGGPKDIAPPVLIKSEPANLTTNFSSSSIRLYFDELVKLKDVQEQLIVSPPLKYLPDITPQGGANKFIEIKIKDTLLKNTTYTLNFGQSIIDNNEGNPNSFLTYVFSTGDYIDSLEVMGAVKDAFNKKADDFISVMLYKIDTSYTDSTIYKRPPNYITNTLDSAVIFNLKNLKEGKYAMFALKDDAKNNTFDQSSDKIAFLKDTITIPTDSTFLLTLFKEVSDYKIPVPSLVANNRISFGYYGKGDSIKIETLTAIPDTVRTRILKERDKDTINFWFTPFEMDSLLFTVTNDALKVIDTFTVKSRKVGIDSLNIEPNQSSSLDFNTPYSLLVNTPIYAIDSTKIGILDKDSVLIDYKVSLDSIGNKLDFDFEIGQEESYEIQLLPGAIVDFFGTENDTLNYGLRTGTYEDFGSLNMTISTDEENYPLVVQLTDENGKLSQEIVASEPQRFEFEHIKPGNYLIRVIFDENGNKKWDTGSFLKKLQPEKLSYFPDVIEVRANWEIEQTFTVSK